MEQDIMDSSDSGEHDHRQLGVLREFGNIANGVSDEEFLNLMRVAPKLKKVKWQPILKCLKEKIQEGMSESWSGMWQEENLSEKLETLEKQREKYADLSQHKPMWRPQLGDVKAQLKSTDAAILRQQKHRLELEAKEYESRVAMLKKVIIPKRGYLRAMQIEMQNCSKKNEEICKHVDQLLEMSFEPADEISPLSNELDCGVDVRY